MSRFRRWLEEMSIWQSAAWGCATGLAVTVVTGAVRTMPPQNLVAAVVGVLIGAAIIHSLEQR